MLKEKHASHALDHEQYQPVCQLELLDLAPLVAEPPDQNELHKSLDHEHYKDLLLDVHALGEYHSSSGEANEVGREEHELE